MKNFRFIFAGTLFIAISFCNVLASNSDSAKVIRLLGKVTAELKDGTKLDVVMDQIIPEGAEITTAERSFVKLLLLGDKSQMNLGPKSKIKITSLASNQAGIIDLVEGQLRSKVTKDYMQMDDKSKSKLFIKTKSAAMGIRGTEFQVNYNSQNDNTALITFEGEVAMGGIDKAARDNNFSRENLEKVVSDETAVRVKDGQFSAVTQLTDKPMLPTRLAPEQLESLKNNETGIIDNKDAPTEAKKDFKSPIPPGVDATKFSGTNSEMDKQLEKVSDDKTLVSKVSQEVEKNIVKSDGPAEGFFNQETGAFKFPAGSVIDLATVNIIPPPANAQFDSNTQTYILPPNFGKVDPSTGSYKAPEGFQLTSEGKFVAKETATNSGQSGSGNTTRAPASDSKTSKTAAPPSLVPAFLPPNIAANLDPSRGPASGTSSLPSNINQQKLQDLANTKIQDITNSINQNSETNTNNPNSKVRFIFNAQ